jgi:hypothetical protein
MTKRKTTSVAPTRKKPAEPANTVVEISPAGGLPAEKTVAERTPVRRADKPTIKRALEDLAINRPYYTARVVGGRLELRLYGGDVVYWPPDPPPEEA